MKNLLILAFLIFTLKGFGATTEMIPCVEVYETKCDILICEGTRLSAYGNINKRKAYQSYFQSKRYTELRNPELALKTKKAAQVSIESSLDQFNSALNKFDNALSLCENDELELINYIEIVNISLNQAQIASDRISEL